MNKKNITWMMVFVLVMSMISSNIIYIQPISAATMDKLKWEKNDTMDTSMSIIKNKAGDDDVLLKTDLKDTGRYTLEYYLENKRKTEVIIEQKYDSIDIYYKVLENNSPSSADNITQNLITNSYREMDYGSDVPKWVYDGGKLVDHDPDGNEAIKYTIPRLASSKFPGVAFEVDNKRVIIKWDFQVDKLYYLMTGYEEGLIMPVSYTDPTSTKEDLKILKKLEGFEVKPTYLKQVSGDNKEITPILQPDNDGDSIDDSPGARPGLEIKFKQPKEMNMGTWEYTTVNAAKMADIKAYIGIDDIATNEYIDFNLPLHSGSGDGKKINSLPDSSGINKDVKYEYNSDTYKIVIVQDKSDLANKDRIIQWDKLAPSKIYNIDIDFQVDSLSSSFDDYEFKKYLPENKFAYTYMEYRLKRVNMGEAFLDITPYETGSSAEVEYKILYSKVVKPVLDAEHDLWAKHYYRGDHDDNIYVPVDFNKESSQSVYQVVVKFSSVDIYSQVLNYDAGADTKIPPSTPRIKEIDNLYVVPNSNPSISDPVKSQFDLIWSAPPNKTIKELDTILQDVNDRIYYEVMVNDLPTGSVSNPYEVIKIFEVYKEAGKYKVKRYNTLPGTATPSDVDYENGYNSLDELFRMNDINLYDAGQWTNKITTVVDEGINKYTVTPTSTPANITYPGINYLKIRAITKTGGKIAVSYNSVPKSLSLSTLKYKVPTVDGLTYEPLYGANDIDVLGITLFWDAVDIKDFEKHMLYPIKKEVTDLKYKIYISEDKDALLNLKDVDDTYTKLTVTSDNIDVTVDELTKFRNKEVLYFELDSPKDNTATLDVAIKGLDKNTNYYVRGKTNANTQNVSGGDEETKISELSAILSLTTPVFPTSPGDNEKKPLAPENFDVDFTDDSKLGATLKWEIPQSMTFKQDTYGFEILAIENRSIPKDLDSRETTIENILTSDLLKDDPVESWRLYVEDDGSGGDKISLKKYNSTTQEWDIQDSGLFNVELPNFTMEDDSNTPNKVNYYYVRTIRIDDEGDNDTVKSASSWAKGSLTTAPVKAPINLIVDYSGEYSSNPKTQTIIRFDAPIPDGASLLTDYIIEVHVKGENDADYSNTKYSTYFLGENSEGINGYRRLYYRISDLDPGERYNIKVRIEDRTKDMEVLPGGSSQYPKSPFSALVSTRTDFDQTDYDKENKYKEYIDYYKEKAEDLKKVSYFELENTGSRNVIKYRDNYGIGELKRFSSGEYSIGVEDKDINIIYLPSTFLKEVNSNKVTLEIKAKKQQIGIRPNSLGVDITDEINDVIEDMKDYDSDIEDYYIRITVDIDDYNHSINGKDAISDLVEMSIDVIGSEDTEEKIDDKMIEEIDWAIEHNKSNLISDIEDELDDGIDDEKLLDIVQKVLEDVKEDYRDELEDALEYSLDDHTEDDIDELDEDMMILLKPNEDEEDTDAIVYMEDDRDWEEQSSTSYANAFYIDTNIVTSYILVPSGQNDSITSETYNSEGGSLINKYKLREVFTSNELLFDNTLISKQKLFSSFARLIGANKDNDNASYLKNRGIGINSSNITDYVKREEALNVYVQVFARKNGVDLRTVNILDYNIIEDINEVDNKYKNNLIKGANLGIIELKSGRVNPNDLINIKDTIELLTLIEKGID